MNQAEMRLTRHFGKDSTIVTLLWLGLPLEIGIWYCRPGHIGGVTHGKWIPDHIPASHSSTGPSIRLYDDDFRPPFGDRFQVAICKRMNVSLFKYPLSGLAGTSGEYSMYARGGIMYQGGKWELLSV